MTALFQSRNAWALLQHGELYLQSNGAPPLWPEKPTGVARAFKDAAVEVAVMDRTRHEQNEKLRGLVIVWHNKQNALRYRDTAHPAEYEECSNARTELETFAATLEET